MKTQQLTIALFTLLLSCCTSRPVEEVNDGQKITEAFVLLSESQSKSIAIETAPIQNKKVYIPITVTGVLDVPPQNMIDVSAPYGGFVKNTSLLQGMRIKKGDVLVELQHQDYIQLQQDYLQQVSQLQLAESEYNRQIELSKENVNAQKSLQQAKAQFESSRAMVQGLSAKLSLLNINVESLNAGIQKSIRLFSPISGYVTDVNINIGKYVTPSDVMIRIVNTEHLHAELQVFEKDITKVKIGQQVKFKLGDESVERMADVYLIGREISSDRTVRVHCHLNKEDVDLLPGMFITASIETQPQEIRVLPSSAIVEHEGKKYIFASSDKKNQYDVIEVETGLQQDEATEVKLPEERSPDTQYVVKGAYTLLSLIFNTEEE
jgi:membrane fusion protein, heavy metal efflux system